MGKHKPKRGSDALKKYWRDIRAARSKLDQPTSDVRRAYRISKEQGFERDQANREDLFDALRAALGGELRLGETVFMDLDSWMNRAKQNNYQNRFELQFYDSLAEDLSAMRRQGDEFFRGDKELGPPSYYWRIRLPIAVYFGGPKGLEYYRYVWPDANDGRKTHMKTLKKAVDDAEKIMNGDDMDEEEFERQARRRGWVKAKTQKSKTRRGTKGKWKAPKKGEASKKKKGRKS